MKKNEKKAIKLVKKGFTLEEWKLLSSELKKNELVLSELAKKLEKYDVETLRELTNEFPFVLNHLTDKKQLQLVDNRNFCFLSEDLQMRIIEKNNKKAKYANENVQIKFATLNPLELSFLSENVQRKMIDSNNFYLEFALKDIQVEYAKKDPGLLCRCSNLVQCWFVKLNPNNYLRCNAEVRKDIISLNNLSAEKISVETLEAYLSAHYDNLSLEELDNYREQIVNSSREDKEEILDYMQYLQVNMEKKRL